MTRKEKITYTIIGIIVLILLWLAFHKRRPIEVIVENAKAPDTGPYYLTYNYPTNQLPLVNTDTGVLASQSDPAAALPTCGCNSSSAFFKSSRDLTDYFNKQLTGLADAYMENVVGTLPDWFGQYINNTTGASLSWASQRGLQSI